MIVLSDYEGGLNYTFHKRSRKKKQEVSHRCKANLIYLPSKKGKLNRTALAVGCIHLPGGASHGQHRRQPNLLHNLCKKKKSKSVGTHSIIHVYKHL